MRHALKVPCLLSGYKADTSCSRRQTHDVAVAIAVATTYDDRHSFRRWKDSNERSQTPLRRSYTDNTQACACTAVGWRRATTGTSAWRGKRANTVVASSASIDWSLISSHNANRSRRHKLRIRVLHVPHRVLLKEYNRATRRDGRTDGRPRPGDIKDSETRLINFLI